MVSTRSTRSKPASDTKLKPHKAAKKQASIGKQNKVKPLGKLQNAKKVSRANSQLKSKTAAKSGKIQVVSAVKVSKPNTKVKPPTKKPSTVVKTKNPPNVQTPVKPSSKYLHYSSADYSTFKKHQEDLDDKKLPELKDMCRKNLMKVSGNKSELIERIADARILGVIPKCPSCGGGRPKLDPKTMTYYCSGYLEDVKFINCHKSFPYASISRVPWQS